MATPASTEFSISTKTELSTYLSDIVKSVDNYIQIKDQLATVEKGQQLQVNGVVLDKTKLRAMHSQIVKSIEGIAKHVSLKQAKKVKADGVNAKPRSNGFDNPVFVNKYIVRFFTERAESLGLDPQTRQALNALLPLLVKNELTTSSILTSLWTIYTNVQKDKISTVVKEVDSKTNKEKETKYYHADDNMMKCFGPSGSSTFSRLSAKPSKISKAGKELQPFNPARFSYTGWQSIYSDNKLSLTGVGENKLTPERDLLLKNMKEWKTLVHLTGADLTAEKQADITAVTTRQIPANASAEKKAYLTNLINAKAYHDQLVVERDIVANALKTINAAKPVTVKKSRAKAVAVPAPVI
jgi:hypothetical protein